MNFTLVADRLPLDAQQTAAGGVSVSGTPSLLPPTPHCPCPCPGPHLLRVRPGLGGVPAANLPQQHLHLGALRRHRLLGSRLRRPYRALHLRHRCAPHLRHRLLCRGNRGEGVLET